MGWAVVELTFKFINTYVGFGAPVFDARGNFKYFDKNQNPTCFDVSLWLSLVPEKFKTQAEASASKASSRMCDNPRQVVSEELHFSLVSIIYQELLRFKSCDPKLSGDFTDNDVALYIQSTTI